MTWTILVHLFVAPSIFENVPVLRPSVKRRKLISRFRRKKEKAPHQMLLRCLMLALFRRAVSEEGPGVNRMCEWVG